MIQPRFIGFGRIGRKLFDLGFVRRIEHLFFGLTRIAGNRGP